MEPSFQKDAQELKTKLKNGELTESDIPLLNQIDDNFTAIRKKSEALLRTYSHKEDWSPTIRDAYFINQFWIAQFRSHIMGEDYSERIQTIKSRIKQPLLVKTSYKFLHEKCQSSFKHLKFVRNNSLQLREQFILNSS